MRRPMIKPQVLERPITEYWFPSPLLRLPIVVLVINLVAMFSGASSAVAKPACNVQLVHPAQITVFSGIPYDLFGEGRQTVRVDFDVIGLTLNCTFYVGISSAEESQGIRTVRQGGASLAYWLSLDSAGGSILRDWPQDSRKDLLSGRLNLFRLRESLTYFIQVNKGQVVASGRYSDPVTVTVYRKSGNDLVPVDHIQVTFDFDVEPAILADIGIDSVYRSLGATTHVLDFGDMETGQRRTAELVVRANTPYSLSLDSLNGGAMRRDGGGADEVISYSLRIDGAGQSLTRPVTLSVSTPFAQGGQVRHRLEFTLGDTTRAPAGTYSDTIRTTVEAR